MTQADLVGGGGSVQYFDKKIAEWIEEHFQPEDKILDVGAGRGKWGDYLKDLAVVDAVEINPKNIVQFELSKKYRNVFAADIREFTPDQRYDLVIFSDVLEHMSIMEAKEVLRRFMILGSSVVVQLPYLWEQGHIEEDDWEVHVQPDLTAAVIKERYPDLTLLIDDDAIGVYYWLVPSRSD